MSLRQLDQESRKEFEIAKSAEIQSLLRYDAVTAALRSQYQLYFFPPDTNAHLLDARHCTQTTRVRSSGSQVIVGNRNHRAEPVPVLRRARTLTDEQRQQRVGSRALSLCELWPQSAKERRRES